MLQTPGRQVVTRSPHRRVGYVSCPWFQDTQIQYESLLEQSFIRIALLCPGVTSIQSQPFKLSLPSGSTYTPDFLIRCASGNPLVVEVKPRSSVKKHRAKLHEAAASLKSHGYHFLLSTDEEIHQGGRSERAALVLRYARCADSSSLAQRFLATPSQIEYPQTLGDVSEACGLLFHQALGLVGLRCLFLRGDLSLDMVYDHKSITEADDGYLSASTWLRCADW
ncbi:TnsA endonuclease N-terminal domain-containing protein [Achromobacter xylosoxidans]|mgnify:CR=1 FL=1|uniref:TnsA endonuclease N-terminal domain-containing protein n=1 Tax=Alcaligenes xylosoxydans xylosoxydans TaxID=85698 RepID=UPI00128C5A86|nr:TnsA endonuclease N-terminal domain-containing protein [Achromobacter xylosoxidans]